MHAAAATAFLEHAAQAHDLGRWTASPRALRPLVAIALHRRCRPFFWKFYEHGEYHNPYYKLEVHAAAAAAIGRGVRCAAPPALPGATRPALRFSAAQACIQMGHLHALRQLVPASRDLVEHDQGSILLVQAVSAREPAVVQLLLETGAQATMRAVQHALAGTPHPGILRALLGAARPAVLEMQSHFSYLCWTCPILYLLDASNRRQMASAACLERARLGGGRDWLPALTHPLRPAAQTGTAPSPEYRHAAADCMALLAEAGYRPHVYKSLRLSWGLPQANCNPLEAAPELFRIHTTNRRAWGQQSARGWLPVGGCPSLPAHGQAPPLPPTLLLPVPAPAGGCGRRTSGRPGRPPPTPASLPPSAPPCARCCWPRTAAPRRRAGTAAAPRWASCRPTCCCRLRARRRAPTPPGCEAALLMPAAAAAAGRQTRSAPVCDARLALRLPTQLPACLLQTRLACCSACCPAPAIKPAVVRVCLDSQWMRH